MIVSGIQSCYYFVAMEDRSGKFGSVFSSESLDEGFHASITTKHALIDNQTFHVPMESNSNCPTPIF